MADQKQHLARRCQGSEGQRDARDERLVPGVIDADDPTLLLVESGTVREERSRVAVVAHTHEN